METDEKQDVSESGAEGADVLVYELGYHILPTVAEEALAGEVDALKTLLVQADGVFIAEEAPKRINLAYKMEKGERGKNTYFDSAYFGWMKFELLPEKTLELKDALENRPNMLRFLLIKTVREDTRVGWRAELFEERESGTTIAKAPVVGRAPEGERPIISEEELDKSIEELVGEK